VKLPWADLRHSLFLLVNGIIDTSVLTMKAAALAAILVIALCVVIEYVMDWVSPDGCGFISAKYTADPVYAWHDATGQITAYKVDFALDVGDNVQHFYVLLTPKQLQTLREEEHVIVRAPKGGGLVLDNWGLTTGKL